MLVMTITSRTVCWIDETFAKGMRTPTGPPYSSAGGIITLARMRFPRGNTEFFGAFNRMLFECNAGRSRVLTAAVTILCGTP